MNQKVLSKYDLLTVGETAGVTVEEAKKYANNEGTELGMCFHFEHVDGTPGVETKYGKWTTEKPRLSANAEDLHTLLQATLRQCRRSSHSAAGYPRHCIPAAPIGEQQFSADRLVLRVFGVLIGKTGQCLHRRYVLT